MVGVAQLVELQVVALVVAGSSPVAHPNFKIADCEFRIADWKAVNAFKHPHSAIDNPRFICARSSAG